MKRTHYTVKAQRARKAWKLLKKQTRYNVKDHSQVTSTNIAENNMPEMV